MKKSVYNCATGKNEIVDMSPEEIAAHEKSFVEPVRQPTKLELLEQRIAELEKRR